jgi:hypothetical protein
VVALGIGTALSGVIIRHWYGPSPLAIHHVFIHLTGAPARARHTAFYLFVAYPRLFWLESAWSLWACCQYSLSYSATMFVRWCACAIGRISSSRIPQLVHYFCRIGEDQWI